MTAPGRTVPRDGPPGTSKWTPTLGKRRGPRVRADTQVEYALEAAPHFDFFHVLVLKLGEGWLKVECGKLYDYVL